MLPCNSCSYTLTASVPWSYQGLPPSTVPAPCTCSTQRTKWYSSPPVQTRVPRQTQVRSGSPHCGTGHGHQIEPYGVQTGPLCCCLRSETVHSVSPGKMQMCLLRMRLPAWQVVSTCNPFHHTGSVDHSRSLPRYRVMRTWLDQPPEASPWLSLRYVWRAVPRPWNPCRQQISGMHSAQWCCSFNMPMVSSPVLPECRTGFALHWNSTVCRSSSTGAEVSTDDLSWAGSLSCPP